MVVEVSDSEKRLVSLTRSALKNFVLKRRRMAMVTGELAGVMFDRALANSAESDPVYD